MRRRFVRLSAVWLTILLAVTSITAQGPRKPPLAAADIDAIATLLMLEDARTFDEAELQRISKSAHPEVRRRAVQAVGRIADKRGATFIEVARQDRDVEVAATAVWAAGQLRDPAAIAWLTATLSAPATPEPVAREAAIALGKIQPLGRTRRHFRRERADANAHAVPHGDDALDAAADVVLHRVEGHVAGERDLPRVDDDADAALSLVSDEQCRPVGERHLRQPVDAWARLSGEDVRARELRDER